MVCDIVTENLIKGIIVANSRTGITVQEIANVFQECTGEYWPFLHSTGLDANQYLQQIDGILSISNENNEKLWYVRGKTLNGENRGKIYRSNNPPIASSSSSSGSSSHFDLSNQPTWSKPHGSIHNTCNQHKSGGSNGGGGIGIGGSGNSNNFGYGRNNKYGSSERNNNGFSNHNTNNINGNYAPRNTMQQRFYQNNGMHANFGSSNRNGVCNSPSGSGPKTEAALHDFDLVGDDFFMEIAKIDLNSSFSTRKRIRRSGLCISGQGIRDATDRIKRYPDRQNMKIIINLGSIDILHGRDLVDICQDYVELMNVCQRRRIQTIITTLAPLANRLHCQDDTKKLQQFNDFLMSKYPDKVIDIASCMVSPAHGKTMFACYQAEPKYVSGSNQPHWLWNRIGRQRILKKINQNLPV